MARRGSSNLSERCPYVAARGRRRTRKRLDDGPSQSLRSRIMAAAMLAMVLRTRASGDDDADCHEALPRQVSPAAALSVQPLARCM